MKNNELIKKSCGAGVVVACCFGLVGFTLTALGLVSAALIFNQYADYILMPAFGFFAWSLFSELKRIKNQILKYLFIIIIVGLTVYFSLYWVNFLLIALGALINFSYVKLFKRKC